MCVVHKPKIPKQTAEDDKPLPILRNPFLDGMLGNIAALRNGRNSLRIPLNPLGIPVGGGFGGGMSGGSGGSSGGVGGGSTGGSSGGSSGGGGSFSGSSSSSGGGGGFSGGSIGIHQARL